ncbi:hypothetical protein EV421DRAFT_1735574 [Armillaria borealis]|uniref:Uncharacterized protein n=1 Tax=Armillaria borealis TaxID=47425 RepID=A0AA39MRZ7_9AGAR|nr:hypothetical protein EV421DRAFT_1735574 [Armillaria borealis]
MPSHEAVAKDVAVSTGKSDELEQLSLAQNGSGKSTTSSVSREHIPVHRKMGTGCTCVSSIRKVGLAPGETIGDVEEDNQYYNRTTRTMSDRQFRGTFEREYLPCVTEVKSFAYLLLGTRQSPRDRLASRGRWKGSKKFKAPHYARFIWHWHIVSCHGSRHGRMLAGNMMMVKLESGVQLAMKIGTDRDANSEQSREQEGCGESASAYSNDVPSWRTRNEKMAKNQEVVKRIGFQKSNLIYLWVPATPAKIRAPSDLDQSPKYVENNVLRRSFGGSETNTEGICRRKAQKDAYSAHDLELGVAGAQLLIANLGRVTLTRDLRDGSGRVRKFRPGPDSRLLSSHQAIVISDTMRLAMQTELPVAHVSTTQNFDFLKWFAHLTSLLHHPDLFVMTSPVELEDDQTVSCFMLLAQTEYGGQPQTISRTSTKSIRNTEGFVDVINAV